MLPYHQQQLHSCVLLLSTYRSPPCLHISFSSLSFAFLTGECNNKCPTLDIHVFRRLRKRIPPPAFPPVAGWCWQQAIRECMKRVIVGTNDTLTLPHSNVDHLVECLECNGTLFFRCTILRHTDMASVGNKRNRNALHCAHAGNARVSQIKTCAKICKHIRTSRHFSHSHPRRNSSWT
jgi:hypothetical protein